MNVLLFFNSPLARADKVLDVPYIRQVGDTADEFEGCWACGATSAVMIVAYYGRLQPDQNFWVHKCDGGHKSEYGKYVSMQYEAYGYTFDLGTRMPLHEECPEDVAPSGAYAYGAYGYIHYPNGYAHPRYAKGYFRRHGLFSKLIGNRDDADEKRNPTFDEVKSIIDKGDPVWASTNLWRPSGHIVVIKGYTDDGYFIVNDPWPYGYDRCYMGSDMRYTWNEMETGSKWIVIADPIRPGDTVEALYSDIRIRSGPGLSFPQIGYVGSIGTVVDDYTYGCFYNSDGYTWWKIQWDNGLVGWSACGDKEDRNGGENWIEKVTTTETLSVSLTADPSSGNAPLDVTLTADVSGTATGTINYTFWWNCNDPGTSVDDVMNVCGYIPTPSPGSCASNENGIKCDGVTNDPKIVSHTYSSPGTYTAKVIAERGSADPAEDRVTIIAINPTASVSPTSGPPGTQFLLTWSGFTPNSTLTSHLKKPDGTEFPTLQFNTNSQGEASHTVNSTGFSPGTYEHWAVDDSTGIQSNTVSFTVTSNPTISGYVRTEGGSGISGVTLSFSNGGGSTTTNSSGYYSKQVPYGWSGTVTPSKSGYTFSPPSRSYSNVTSNQTNQNYTGSPPCYTLSISISPNGSGSVSKSPDKSCYYNENVTLTATANPGYSFDHWGGALSGSSNPATIYMNSNKSVTAYFSTIINVINVTTPEEFQDALTVAESNGQDDVINVAAGTYNITSTLTYSTNNGDNGHKLTIQGAGADKTVLDGGGSVRILYINTDADHNGGDAGGDVTIKGIAFENGYYGYDWGGGVYVHGSSINITIKQCAFSENSADYGGGVCAFSDSGTVAITNNTFSENSANDGGGVYAGSDSGTVTITNNTFSENSANEYDDGGVCAFSDSGTVAITNNTFSGNSANGHCGGVHAHSYSGTVTITNNTFSGNSAGYGGGGAQAWSHSGTVTITNNTFSENSANDGGGVYAGSDSGTVTITNNTFSGNSAGYGGGGAQAWSHSGTVAITNNTFSENSAGYGGGVRGYLLYDSATLNVYNNIFFNNTANAGDDLYVNSDGDGNYIGSTVNLYNNDFSGNADFDTGQSEDLYISLTDNYHHADNIQKDPQFVDPENGDFHLKPSSPCIDAGTAGAPGLPDSDFQGDPRVVGPAPDIGADEVVTKRLPGDCNGDGTVTIDEVQKCINCFLSIENDCCDKCDVNSNGQVTIDEVQKVINAFLGIV